MAYNTKRARYSTQQREPASIISLIFKGVLVSLLVSLVCILLLTVISLVTESLIVENYQRYIMIGVTMVSVFLGSVFSAHRAKSGGLLIGIGVGAIYVLLSLALGMEVSRESVNLLVLLNKLAAGLAVGALGAFVGVNL